MNSWFRFFDVTNRLYVQLFYSDDNDANCTYEGDNNVLLQQTSNWLMSAWREKRMSSPFKSLNFLENSEKLIRTSFSLDDFTNLDQLLLIFQALTTHLLVSTNGKIKSLLEKGHNEFQVINEIQTMIMMPFPSMAHCFYLILNGKRRGRSVRW